MLCKPLGLRLCPEASIELNPKSQPLLVMPEAKERVPNPQIAPPPGGSTDVEEF